MTDPGIIPGRVTLRRPDDLVVLDATFGGFVLKSDPPRLERSASDAWIVVEFPPQSFGEEAYLQTAGQKFTPNPNVEDTEVTRDPAYPKKNVAGGTETPPASLPAAKLRMSGPSRVAVTMPSEVETIGFDAATILTALRDWPMRLDSNAVADEPARLDALLHTVVIAGLEQLEIEAGAYPTVAEGTAATTSAASTGVAATLEDVEALLDLSPIKVKAGPRPPEPATTALELPYRVVTSPLTPARWAHTIAPVEHRGRVELWHTRLTTSEFATGADLESRIRALWSPDYRPKDKIKELFDLLATPGLTRMSLDPLDRSMLVTVMTGFDERTEKGRPYLPVSSEARRLHLSALGALLDAEGTWGDTPQHIDLQQWRHIATLGRDQYVRVMYAGYLWPFGHAASLIKVTERKFESFGPSGSRRVAILRQRFFVAVREPVRFYDGRHHAFRGRNFPFTRVELLTRLTPDLSDPGVGDSGEYVSHLHGGELAKRMLFWPMVPAGSRLADVPFEVAALDLNGHTVTFSLPLLFVGKLAEATKPKEVAAAYNSADALKKRRALTGEAAVTFAPAAPSDRTEPTFPASSITFKAAALARPAKPTVYPEIDVAQVGIKAIQKLLSQPAFTAEVAYPTFYAEHGFDATKNPGQIFLKLTAAKTLPFGGSASEAKSDAVGAIATPVMQLLGLSKIMGPVSGNGTQPVENALAAAKENRFEPADFFADATLLGGIKLGEILPVAHDLQRDDVPKMVTREFPDRVESRFDWSSDVTKPDGRQLLVPRADSSKPPTRLTMSGVRRTPRDPAVAASSEATATLTNFKVNLFGCIILWFEEIAFIVKDGRKPDVAVRLREGENAVCFGGPLEFVNDLRKFIPSNGFSDPPALAVTPSGMSASYSLTLPGIGIGIFALTNASLGAGFNLPFDSRPVSVRFNFSRREQPFSLTVSLLGGGGFFAIGVSAHGVNEIEAALEFGAAVVIDLGVASGSVEIKAGVYFHWLEEVPDKGMTELAGYVRIHGELTVIAIISVSLTFHLQLGYIKKGGMGTAYGEATLTVEIEILMFSAEVSVKCSREFGGGEADPRFLQLMPTQSLWTEYCDAFAVESF